MNRFALLDDEGSSRPASPPAAPKQAPQPEAPKRDADKAKTGPASRGGKYYQRGGPSKQVTPRGDSGNLNQNGVDDAPEAKRGRGRGRGRGGRGAGSGSGRGRAYDKHSQTGKTDSDKKIHQSWGGDDGETELKVENQASNDAAAETSADAWGASATTDADAWGSSGPAAEGADAAAAPAADGDRRPRREREPEEEDNTLTLEQYLAKKGGEDSSLPTLAEKREVTTGDTWKDVVPLQKGDDDAYFVGKKQTGGQKARPKKEEKIYLEIDARFERPARGGRGGRGFDRGGRGSRGGRGGRGGYNNNSAAAGPDVDDEKAFPSLA